MTNLCAVILAAGLSTRMGGSPKALCHLGEQTFLQRALHSFRAAGVISSVVVTGHAREIVTEHAHALGTRTVHNLDYETGMFSSIRTGIAHVHREGRFQGCFLLPVDIPLVSPQTISQLIDAWQADDRRESLLFIPQQRGRTGHPPLIGENHFAPALDWTGGEGFRGYMASLLSQEDAARLRSGTPPQEGPIVCVSVADDGILFDIDTPADLAVAGKRIQKAQENIKGT